MRPRVGVGLVCVCKANPAQTHGNTHKRNLQHARSARAPASSSASHAPTQLGGCVHRNVESWWGTTSPPIRGCLKMYLFYKMMMLLLVG